MRSARAVNSGSTSLSSLPEDLPLSARVPVCRRFSRLVRDVAGPCFPLFPQPKQLRKPHMPSSLAVFAVQMISCKHGAT